MAMAYKNGSMELCTKENGSIIRQRARVLSGMLKVTFMLVILRRIRLMVMESILMSMVPGMKENGSMMSKKAKARRLGSMALNILENIKMAKKTETVFILGLMAANSKDSGKKIKLQVMEHITGKMVEFMKGIGNKIICTGKARINGQMAGNIKVTI